MAGVRRVRILVAIAAIWILAFWYYRVNPSILAHDSQQAPPVKAKKSWTKRPDKYPIDPITFTALPEARPDIKLPQIQAKKPVEDKLARELRLTRLAAVKESFEHSWNGYAAHAWMHDEVTPLTGKYKDPFGGWAATLIDSLDTLWIMGMKKDFEKAVLATKDIDFSRSPATTINVFETTIRYLGGLLAAFEVSNRKYPILLGKAVELGDFLMKAFDTPNRMPITRWEWKKYAGGADQVAHQQVLVSEIGSLSLEFTKLSQLSGDMRYYDAVRRVADQFDSSQLDTHLPGMWPVVVDAVKPSFVNGKDFTLGAMSDSVYEYLPKQYLLMGGTLEQPRRLYENFMQVAKKHLFYKAVTPWKTPVVIPADLAVSEGGKDKNGKDIARFRPTHRAQHLTCFTGGMVGLASRIFHRPEEMELATQLTDGCVWAYNSTQSGVAPEIFTYIPCGSYNTKPTKKDPNPCAWAGGKWYKAIENAYASEFKAPAGVDPKNFNKPTVQQFVDRLHIPKGMTMVNDGRYILRPEAIESVFVMYRLTGNPEWMEKAWVMFTHIEATTRTDVAASAVDNVTKKKPAKMDSMESFWLAETLKYFYLIFSDFELVSLDKWVYNTEAHPLRRMDV